jgi:CMD domain protein
LVEPTRYPQYRLSSFGRKEIVSTSTPDIIDFLAGIETGSVLDHLRSERPQARENAQKSFLALFAPAFPSRFTAIERFIVASFVVGLHQQPNIGAFYFQQLTECGAGPETVAALRAETTRGSTVGPYGNYPAGPLSSENKSGLVYRVAEQNQAILGHRLSAALEHAHLLVFRPRDASPQALQVLLDAGWSADEVVTLSQLISFLAFQIRVIAGLSVLASTVKKAAA